MLFCLLLSCCTRQQTFDRIMAEARLHVISAPDSTLLLLDQIADAAYCNDSAVRAYYTLLRAQAAWRLYKDMPSDTALASTVRFFRHPVRQPELCTAIYYRAMPLYEQGRHAEATALLLEGVRMAEAIADDSLRSKYYESLCMVNENAQCYEYWLHYAKKFLDHSLYINKVEYIIRSMNEVSGAFGKLGQRDSSMAYLLNSLSMLDKTTESDKALMLANIGCKYLTEQQYDLAEKYLLASIQLVPRANALSALGDLYASRNDVRKADSVWSMALQTASPTMKLLTLRSILDSRLGNGKTEELRSLYHTIRDLEDSLNMAANTEKIAEIQAKYDKERADSRYYRYLSYIFAVLLLVVLVFAVLWIYYHRKLKGFVSVIEKNRQKIREYKSQIETLTSQGEENDGEIARLNNKIKDLQADINLRIGKGKEIYDMILEKEILPSNDPSNESCLIAYYSVQKYAVYQAWMDTYTRLSTRLLTYLVLQDMGYDDAKIAKILSVENSTIRSIKTRLKKRQKD